ncbi:VOC family protein [Streptomyces sp. GbtcB7]|uniref:VOC family protein n=1 Tax=Streptomyces sp. GbtcB7 TaxID=2824752 RepID=UPI001C2FB8A9|nr:VOC family protein [Streptomyces sp. GbtcB7]
MSGLFPAVGHVVLTVSDLDRSVAWYERLFDAPPLIVDETGGFRFAAWARPGVALHAFPDRPTTEAFSEFRPGLDHLAFACASPAALDAWSERLDGLGIAHSGVTHEPYGSALSFRDPDNIALEFFAHPAATPAPPTEPS